MTKIMKRKWCRRRRNINTDEQGWEENIDNEYNNCNVTVNEDINDNATE